MRWWLENVRMWFKGELFEGAIEVDTRLGTIVRIARMPQGPAINGKGLLLLPGMIDIHVHLRDLEESHKEDFRSGSWAALHGGVTTVFDMPNKKPPVATLDDLTSIQEKARKEGLIDIFSYALFTKKDPSWGPFKFVKAVYGGTHGVKGSSLSDLVWAAENLRGILTLHLEDPNLFNAKAELHHDVRPPKSEYEAVRALFQRLSKEPSAHVHIAHLSTANGLKILLEQQIQNISCEATPHHAFLDTSHHQSLDNRMLVNPPVRPKNDRRAIHKGLVDGSIDVIASDHAPHTLEEKENLGLAGIPGLETTLPLLLTDMAKGNIELARIVKLFSERPAALMGLMDRAIVSEGRLADLILIDPKCKWKLDADDLYTKCKWSPFEGKSFVGGVAATLRRGVVSFMNENWLPGSFCDQVPTNNSS